MGSCCRSESCRIDRFAGLRSQPFSTGIAELFEVARSNGYGYTGMSTVLVVSSLRPSHPCRVRLFDSCVERVPCLVADDTVDVRYIPDPLAEVVSAGFRNATCRIADRVTGSERGVT